jgi:hypothetical protein
MKASNFYYCQNVYNTNSTWLDHRGHLRKPLESSSVKPRFIYASHLTLQEYVLHKREHSTVHEASALPFKTKYIKWTCMWSFVWGPDLKRGPTQDRNRFHTRRFYWGICFSKIMNAKKSHNLNLFLLIGGFQTLIALGLPLIQPWVFRRLISLTKVPDRFSYNML